MKRNCEQCALLPYSLRRIFTDKRLSEEVPGDTLGDDWKGYVFRITGGFDKQGFAMVQGVATNGRVRLMLDGRNGMYSPKRHGCRKRKSIRGCVVGPDLSCLNLAIVKKGPADLPGLTDADSNKPSMRGPKRASKIRKLWGLTKDDDVRLFVPKRKIEPKKEGKKSYVKSPAIQRLVTPVALRRKRRRIALKQERYKAGQEAKAKYEQLLAQVRKEKRSALLSKKREMQSERKSAAPVKQPTEKAPETKKEATKPTEVKKDAAKPSGAKKDTGAQASAQPAKDAPKTQAPKAQTAKDTSKAQAPKAQAPKAQAPKDSAPKPQSQQAPTSQPQAKPQHQQQQPQQQQQPAQPPQQPQQQAKPQDSTKPKGGKPKDSGKKQ